MKSKIIKINDLKIIRQKFKNKKIGLAHGVFDIFHYGHLLHLKKAKSVCDILVVSITSENFINKAPGRPIYNNNQRLKMIESLNFVDFVVLSKSKTASLILSKLKPNVYFKGNDYSQKESDYTGGIFKEKKEAEKYGGRLVFTNEKTLSSTKLINRFSDEIDNDKKKYLMKLKKLIDFDKIQSLIKKTKNQKVLVIGDIILDEYIFATPMGKSPKEHLISMEEKKRESYGGGVIASVNHISAFVKNCYLLSVVGDNTNNNRQIIKLTNSKVKKLFFNQKDYRTIKKIRYLDNANNKLFQISNTRRSEVSKKTEKRILNYLNQNLNKFNHVIVHDFGHGLLTNKIIKLIEKKSKYLSVNVQTNSSNIGFNYITKFSKMDYFSIDEPEARLALSDNHSNTANLFKKFKKLIKFKSASITFGKNGSYSYYKNKVYFSPALTSRPIDTLGAGDAFFVVSSLISIFSKRPEYIGFFGNLAGVYVVNYLGHRKYLNKEIFLNYAKTFINI